MQKNIPISPATIDATPRIDKNAELLSWLYQKVAAGYCPRLNVQEMQKLQDKLVAWYEFKYPARNLTEKNGEYVFVDDMMSSVMTEHVLMSRLTEKERSFFHGRYRGVSDSETGLGTLTFTVCIPEYNRGRHQLKVYEDDGTIFGGYGNMCIPNARGPFTLETFYDKIKDDSSYDSSEFEYVLTTHKLDLELRHALFELVTLSLKSNPNEPVLVTQKRAQKWMQEIGIIFMKSAIAEPRNVIDSPEDDEIAKETIKKIELQTTQNASKSL